MKRILTLLLALSTTLVGLAQDGLFFPRNFKSAYDKGTRSYDGKPGEKYWQNTAQYTIKASINPKNLELTGSETVRYVNNSPDSLRTIRFKLAHDRYRKGSLRSGDVAPEDVSDEGVEIESLKYNGVVLDKGKLRRRNTFMDIRLGAEGIPPGGTATFEVTWEYTLPTDERATRECVCDKTTYFVPYWYPQIAVYDDYRGWANTPYSGTQEFYHDFADYDVTITMPKGFMVWATGEWQNAAKLLQKPILEKWEQAHTSEDVVSIWKEADLKAGTVFNKSKENTFHYIASQVPDFTFATSDHYNWDAVSVEVDASTRRRTLVSAAYDTNSEDYYEVARIAADAIHLFSNWLPGYPFPYPCMTVFNGNDGMEYPMMVNDASVSKDFVTSLTAHEVAHTYFPFMMGINEQEYAWMDEGWANFFDSFIADSLTGSNSSNLRGFGRVAGTDFEVPPMVRSSFLSGSAYGIASYSRPQAAYTTLLDMLGYETFHKCMVEYMDRWKGKHPTPYDFFYTWNDVSGQNLDWYWEPWFFDWAYPDLGINGVVANEAKNTQDILIDRNGKLPIAIHLELEYSDGSKETIHRTAAVWKDGRKQIRLSGAEGKTIQAAKLGDRHIPDSVRENNEWKR
jgi:hypothetical protein